MARQGSSVQRPSVASERADGHLRPPATAPKCVHVQPAGCSAATPGRIHLGGLKLVYAALLMPCVYWCKHSVTRWVSCDDTMWYDLSHSCYLTRRNWEEIQRFSFQYSVRARVPAGALMKDWSSVVPVLSISCHIRTTDAETEDAFNRTNLSLRSLHTYRRNPINGMKHADRGFVIFQFF